jgi:uroporphyrinogen III methyltransferase / synthase
VVTDNTMVYLVGAGPGNSGLLTLRAVECMAQADLVIYDKLVNPRLLELAPQAESVCVTELGDTHAERHGPCQQRMIEAALQGKRVVRLKGGDPTLFGRAGEEAEALREAGIGFEIVPGVTSALGAAAYAGIPLTHREHASAVAFLTGHEVKSNLDWGNLARFPGTLVVYMGLNLLEDVQKRLLREGKDEHTPTAVIQWATTGAQSTVVGTLREVVHKVRAEGLISPCLIVVGSVVSLRTRLQWFERQPLFGKRILVTRPRRQAIEMMRRLEVLGAVPLLLPAVEIGLPPDSKAVDDVIERIASFDWLVFTSGNGVRALLGRLFETGHDLRRLGHIHLAAIGPSTAKALTEYHLRADVVPPQYCSEGLAESLRPLVQGKRVLLARADRGRDLLRQELSRIAEVEQVAVYSQIDAFQHDATVLDAIRDGQVDYVSLTSSNIARSFIRSLDETSLARVKSGSMKLVTISPETSRAVREMGLAVSSEAQQYDLAGVIEAMVQMSEGTQRMS